MCTFCLDIVCLHPHSKFRIRIIFASIKILHSYKFSLTMTSHRTAHRRISIDDTSDAMPLDFTFKKITTLAETYEIMPREGRLGKQPPRGPTGRFLTKAAWFNNNLLTNIIGIDGFLVTALEVPARISWLDFSFNNLKEIDSIILQFQNLTILYFHGNDIEDLDTVLTLKLLPKLKRLTLHGNRVAELAGYRNILVHCIPQLNNLDFVPIVKQERACPISIMHLRKIGKTVSAS